MDSYHGMLNWPGCEFIKVASFHESAELTGYLHRPLYGAGGRLCLSHNGARIDSTLIFGAPAPKQP